MFSIFCDSCKPIIIHPVYMVSPCSSPDFSSFYDILTFADVADIFVENSIPQNVRSDALKILISVILNRHLVMVISALVLMM